jgi:beta-glucanase (GH16 family)
MTPSQKKPGVVSKPRFFPISTCLALLAWAGGLHADPPPGAWTPVFTEDFNGSSLNTAVWNTGMRWGGALPGEPQAYRPENVAVGGGVCTITASVKYGRINHSGGYAANATVLDVDGFDFALANNSYVRIGDKKYKILSSVGGSTPTQITIERAASLPAGTGLVSSVADNALVLAAVPIQSQGGFETDAMGFRSGAIQTYKKWQQTYGYFEARVKMPSGKGTWPAFWLLPDRVAYGTDEYARTAVGDLVTYGDSNAANDITVPMGNEIDVFEHMATWKNAATGLSKSHHGYFWGYAGGQSYGNWGIATDIPTLTWSTYANPDTQFHTFGVYWAPGELRYYIDGVMTFRRTHDATVGVCPHYMILNVALSHDDWAGIFPTDEDIVAGMPSSMQIDYVKVWSGTADNQFVEMEDVASAVSSDALTVYDDTSSGGRKAEKLASNADGDYATYTVPVAQPGTYNIKLRYKAHDTRGRFRLSIDGVNQGGEVDQYSSTPAQAEVDLGNKTFTTAGNKNFTFTVTGKTTGSLGRDLTFDYLKLFPVAVSEITMDSEGSGITLTGTWPASTTTAGYLGSNYLHDGNASKGSKSVKYTPALAASGNYQVSMRWTALSNRATNVPVDIVKSDGTTTTVTVNQTANNGVWMSLGTYPLSPGNASVTIRTTSTDGYVIADGVRFTPQ